MFHKLASLTVGGLMAIMGAITPHTGSSDTANVQESRQPKASISGSLRPTPSAASIGCVASAVDARESAIDSAIATYDRSVETAYSTRRSSLAAAYTKTTTADIRSGVKSAWDTFNTSMRLASKTLKTAQKSALEAFKTTLKGCKASNDVVDTSNASTESNSK